MCKSLNGYARVQLSTHHEYRISLAVMFFCAFKDLTHCLCYACAMQVLMRIADQYDMPAIMKRCTRYLTSNIVALNNTPSTIHSGWKWIALADALGEGSTARACFDVKRLDSKFAHTLSSNTGILQQLSHETLQHVLVTYANQQIGPGQIFCKECQCIADLHKRDTCGSTDNYRTEYTYPEYYCSKCASTEIGA